MYVATLSTVSFRFMPQVFGALADFVYSESVRPPGSTGSRGTAAPSILPDLKKSVLFTHSCWNPRATDAHYAI